MRRASETKAWDTIRSDEILRKYADILPGDATENMLLSWADDDDDLFPNYWSVDTKARLIFGKRFIITKIK